MFDALYKRHMLHIQFISDEKQMLLLESMCTRVCLCMHKILKINSIVSWHQTQKALEAPKD